MTKAKKGSLVLEDGSVFEGEFFGFHHSASGEVVFNTGMVGYPEALTDPSYKGQILVLTYPLIGNYGVPKGNLDDLNGPFESNRIQVAGLIVLEVSSYHDHWDARTGLSQWLQEQGVPALSAIDTRALTKRLRSQGTMLGKIVIDDQDIELLDPNQDNLVAQVSIREPITYEGGKIRIVVIDCGCKNSIIRSLLQRGATVIRVPWNYDFLDEEFDGVLISNGPGDPKACSETIAHVREVMTRDVPVFGLCLGHQVMALAAGCDTYKMKFGHRSQNQPCTQTTTRRCYITAQNHGYAVDGRNLPPGWEPWFTNANDDTNEGLRHVSGQFMSVQFHPEATPGPTDTNHLFDLALETFRCHPRFVRS